MRSHLSSQALTPKYRCGFCDVSGKKLRYRHVLHQITSLFLESKLGSIFYWLELYKRLKWTNCCVDAGTSTTTRRGRSWRRLRDWGSYTRKSTRTTSTSRGGGNPSSLYRVRPSLLHLSDTPTNTTTRTCTSTHIRTRRSSPGLCITAWCLGENQQPEQLKNWSFLKHSCRIGSPVTVTYVDVVKRDCDICFVGIVYWKQV